MNGERVKQKWERRYQSRRDAGLPAPCTLLTNFQYLLPRSGTALDLACGRGGNAVLLAQRGLHTTACDLSPTAVDQLQVMASQLDLAICAQHCDTAKALARTAHYHVITISLYLDRGIIPLIQRALRPGGLIYYQTFTRVAPTQQGPRNPAYRLHPGELLSFFRRPQWLIAYYREEGLLGDTGQGLRGQACLVAQKEMR